MSRDPNRIPPMLALIGEIWIHSPDLRLGQLIENAFVFDDPTVEDNMMYNLEDEVWQRKLQKYRDFVKTIHKVN